MGIKESSSTLIKLKSSIRYFSFFSKKKMKISYSCLIVAVVIGLGTVTATPADDVKAVAEDAAKLADSEYDAKLAGLVREAADPCQYCAYCPKCAVTCPSASQFLQEFCEKYCGHCEYCKEHCG